MSDECRPPDGTPDKAKCLLVKSGRYFQGDPELFTWRSGTWRRPFFGTMTPHEAGRSGWRFHSIAEPPNA